MYNIQDVLEGIELNRLTLNLMHSYSTHYLYIFVKKLGMKGLHKI